jgi:hypothetical protein
VVLPGGEEQHPPAGTGVLVLGGEGLGEQQAGAGVDRVAEVQLGGGEVLQVLSAAAGVVGDEGVDVAEGVACGGDDGVGCGGVGEVGAEMLDPAAGCA